MRIAVVGAGSSGLITLKYLREAFPTAEIICYEKSDNVRGCWGEQRPSFVSTSSKYTTQFSCFRQWSLETTPEKDYAEFYRGAEFGDYLEAFADHFNLRSTIRFGCALSHLAWDHEQACWTLNLIENGQESTTKVDALFLCTGLVNQKLSLPVSRGSFSREPGGNPSGQSGGDWRRRISR